MKAVISSTRLLCTRRPQPRSAAASAMSSRQRSPRASAFGAVFEPLKQQGPTNRRPPPSCFTSERETLPQQAGSALTAPLHSPRGGPAPGTWRRHAGLRVCDKRRCNRQFGGRHQCRGCCSTLSPVTALRTASMRDSRVRVVVAAQPKLLHEHLPDADDARELLPSYSARQRHTPS